VIPPLPLNKAFFISNPAEPLCEVINAGCVRERKDSLDVGNTVESIECGREHFRSIGRSNQRILFVGTPKEAAGENVNSAIDGAVELGCG
jgi:hypothetical protein